MRPVRTIAVFAFAAALAVAGCAAQRAAVQPPPSPAPVAATPVATTPPSQPVPLTPPPNTPTGGSLRQAPHHTPAGRSTPTPPTAPRLYFSTPDAAMRYLTVAYNHNDLAALAHVTTPVARANLLAMHRTAVNLRLVGCTARAGLGDYTCTFTHDFPPERHLSGHGHAHFIAAPADKHGWYMTVLEDCD
jgi:hypothetical protein